MKNKIITLENLTRFKTNYDREVDNKIKNTDKNMSFFTNINKNLFDGKFKDVYVAGGGNSPTNILPQQYRTLCIDVKPNTTYSIFKEDVGLDDGYYWFKLCTATKSAVEVLNTAINGENKCYNADGSIALLYATTDNNICFKQITTGTNDKSLFITVGKQKTPYVEVLEGSYDNPQYNRYTPLYNPNSDINIYSKDDVYNKHEVNNIVNNKNISSIKYENGHYYIKCGKVVYKLKQDIDTTANLNTFRITECSLDNKSFYVDTDIEGPIHELNQSDFIGGCHGDEIMESIIMLVDGKKIDIGTPLNTTYSSIEIFVTSKLFHCNTNNQCFTRFKKLSFKKDVLTISNVMSCADTFVCDRWTGGGLFSIYKEYLNYYETSLVPNSLKEIPRNTSQGSFLINPTHGFKECYFYGNGYKLTLRTIGNNVENQSKGFIQDFATDVKPRLKIYLDAINNTNGYTINKGDIISASYQIEII